MRWKLTIEYDGRPFAGWQRQDGSATVQGVLEAAAAQLNEGAPVEAVGAGRTDAGVHALGQVAHLDLERDLTAAKLRDALNAHLRPHPVAVLEAQAVSDRFHARFDATSRNYRYCIVNRRADLTLDAGRAWRISQALDHQAMHAAAQALLGRHDFTTFRDSQCQAESPVRTLDAIAVARSDADIEVSCSARSFLHRQVRSLVGSLVEVGRGRRDPAWIGEILAAADRSLCGPVAPPDGLYLTQVEYAQREATIRPFRPADAPALREIFRRAVEAIGPQDYTPEQTAAWARRAPSDARFVEMAADGRTMWVATDPNDRPQGFIDLEADGHIDLLYCDPEVAGRGVAVRLLEAVEARARQAGLARLYTEASEAARRFFLRRGFAVDHRRDLMIDGVAIHNFAMTKTLEPAELQ